MTDDLSERVEELLICSLCLEKFKDPRVLPCYHSFCYKCIVKLYKNDQSGAIRCPNCRLDIQMEESSISTIPVNFLLKSLLTVVKKTRTCDNCVEKDLAVNRCDKCSMYLCQFCSESHRRGIATRDHKLTPLDEPDPSNEQHVQKNYCLKHEREALFFCRTCNKIICRECTNNDHKNHDYETIENAADESRRFLKTNVDQVNARRIKVEKTIKDLKEFQHHLERGCAKTIEEIDRHFDEMITEVENCRKKIIAQATSINNSRYNIVETHLERLEATSISCRNNISLIHRAFAKTNDVQLLKMKNDIFQSLEQLQEVTDEIDPCVSGQLIFVKPESFGAKRKDLLDKYSVSEIEVDFENCTATFDDLSTIKLFNKSSITLTCFDQYKKRLPYGNYLVEPTFSGVEIKDLSITDNENGSYSVAFCPTTSGYLKCTFSISQTQVPNCTLNTWVGWCWNESNGNSEVSNKGLTMKGRAADEYCYRIGNCSFDSGTQKWKIEISYTREVTRALYTISNNVEVGVIDCDKLQRYHSEDSKCVKKFKAKWERDVIITAIVDMSERSLRLQSVKRKRGNQEMYDPKEFFVNFRAHHVVPFVSCSSPAVSITLLQEQF
ncbi:tripartite motif-containing protein 45-like isoform X2 [Xenia sp. Carnegie-2017]|nr:tripartite motif-containing protein 45-like isoform X2 [Xenia sp. Carnegie-2017]XP_046862543.1 tripartite motif-containing protein 45-like isoform X2 [Xenia sp. Carnegie-2017]